MRIFWTLFWSFLLVHMLTYVVSSMTEGAKYDFAQGSISAIVVTVLILIVTTIIPNEPVQKH
ncbi:YjzD family protein [Neobacillus drentensis]|uniref:YjzD family protein n=1 Tax=Neobacillus drentensis TaxID=220684 RepID=UPI0030005677